MNYPCKREGKKGKKGRHRRGRRTDGIPGAGKGSKQNKKWDQKKNSFVGAKPENLDQKQKSTCPRLSKPCFFVGFAKKQDSTYFFLLIRILRPILAHRRIGPRGWLAGWLAGWLDQKNKSIYSDFKIRIKKKVPAPGSGDLVFCILGYKTHQKPIIFKPWLARVRFSLLFN